MRSRVWRCALRFARKVLKPDEGFDLAAADVVADAVEVVDEGFDTFCSNELDELDASNERLFEDTGV